ncbi:MAG: hypothetical protein AAF847_15200, partial [Bacteroidota bacterium]
MSQKVFFKGEKLSASGILRARSVKSLFGAGLNCKSVVYGSGEENNSDFIEINERLFSKSGSENTGLQED